MRKLYDALCKFEVIACGIGFILLIAMVFLSAILRFFRFSVSWNIDIALFLLAWTAFLGADIAWRSGKLIGIDLFTRHLPPMVQKVLQFLIYIIILCALILIVVNGSRLAWLERARKYQSIPIPFSLMTMSLITACFCMSVTTVLKIKNLLFPPAKTDESGTEKSDKEEAKQ